MKKSKMYRLVQYATLKDTSLDIDEKLEIIKELMAREDVELFFEEEAEKKAAAEAAEKEAAV